MIENAHDTEIHCVTALPFLNNLGVNYATGAMKEIKLWRSEQCISTI
jgi:hypothetical protein